MSSYGEEQRQKQFLLYLRKIAECQEIIAKDIMNKTSKVYVVNYFISYDGYCSDEMDIDKVFSSLEKAEEHIKKEIADVLEKEDGTKLDPDNLNTVIFPDSYPRSITYFIDEMELE